MKQGGMLMTFAAIVGIAEFSDLPPDPDLFWIGKLGGFVFVGLYVAGMLLFGTGVKREAVREALAGRTVAHAEPGAPADGGA